MKQLLWLHNRQNQAALTPTSYPTPAIPGMKQAFIASFFYSKETLLSPGWFLVNACSFVRKLAMARHAFAEAENTFKKLVSELHNSKGLLFPLNFRIWLRTCTAQKLAVRISIAINKTDTEGLSRQHCLFLHGKLQPRERLPQPARAMHGGGTPGSSRKLESWDFPLGKFIHPQPRALQIFHKQEKKGKIFK